MYEDELHNKVWLVAKESVRIAYSEDEKQYESNNQDEPESLYADLRYIQAWAMKLGKDHVYTNYNGDESYLRSEGWFDEILPGKKGYTMMLSHMIAYKYQYEVSLSGSGPRRVRKNLNL
jgi:hypothetical protein